MVTINESFKNAVDYAWTKYLDTSKDIILTLKEEFNFGYSDRELRDLLIELSFIFGNDWDEWLIVDSPLLCWLGRNFDPEELPYTHRDFDYRDWYNLPMCSFDYEHELWSISFYDYTEYVSKFDAFIGGSIVGILYNGPFSVGDLEFKGKLTGIGYEPFEASIELLLEVDETGLDDLILSNETLEQIHLYITEVLSFNYLPNESFRILRLPDVVRFERFSYGNLECQIQVSLPEM